MGGGEAVWVGVSNRYAPLVGENTGGRGVGEDIGPSWLDMDLGERQGTEADLPVAALLQAVENGLVGIAGKRAQIVVGEVELHINCNDLVWGPFPWERKAVPMRWMDS